MNWKKLGGILGGLAGAAGTIIVASHGGKPTPRPVPVPPAPATYAIVVHVFDGPLERDEKIPGAAIAVNELAAANLTDGAGNVTIGGVPGGVATICAEIAGFSRTCAGVEIPKQTDVDLSLVRLTPVVPPADEPLTTNGPIFLRAGVPWRYQGVSAFKLLERFARGEDIEPFLDAFPGYNVLRVWVYTPVKEWGAAAWNAPDAETVLRFVDYVRVRGWYVELTLLTDDDPARGPPARDLVAVLGQARPPNLLLEAGNEPTTHKAIDTAALRGPLERSGLLYTSGDYEDSARMYGRYGVAHTGRDPEWPRRAHDLLEYFGGGGPNSPSDPAHRVPWVCDEPIRPDQAAGDRDRDFLAYFGTCALLGAGGTFHFESGKLATVPTPDERRFAAIALEAMTAFPPDAPRGGYRRPVERSLRTYAVGPFGVRVRPETPDWPEAGWSAIGDGGVLWKR